MRHQATIDTLETTTYYFVDKLDDTVGAAENVLDSVQISRILPICQPNEMARYVEVTAYAHHSNDELKSHTKTAKIQLSTLGSISRAQLLDMGRLMEKNDNLSKSLGYTLNDEVANMSKNCTDRIRAMYMAQYLAESNKEHARHNPYGLPFAEPDITDVSNAMLQMVLASATEAEKLELEAINNAVKKSVEERSARPINQISTPAQTRAAVTEGDPIVDRVNHLSDAQLDYEHKVYAKTPFPKENLKLVLFRHYSEAAAKGLYKIPKSLRGSDKRQRGFQVIRKLGYVAYVKNACTEHAVSARQAQALHPDVYPMGGASALDDAFLISRSKETAAEVDREVQQINAYNHMIVGTNYMFTSNDHGYELDSYAFCMQDPVIPLERLTDKGLTIGLNPTKIRCATKFSNPIDQYAFELFSRLRASHERNYRPTTDLDEPNKLLIVNLHNEIATLSDSWGIAPHKVHVELSKFMQPTGVDNRVHPDYRPELGDAFNTLVVNYPICTFEDLVADDRTDLNYLEVIRQLHGDIWLGPFWGRSTQNPHNQNWLNSIHGIVLPGVKLSQPFGRSKNYPIEIMEAAHLNPDHQWIELNEGVMDSIDQLNEVEFAAAISKKPIEALVAIKEELKKRQRYNFNKPCVPGGACNSHKMADTLSAINSNFQVINKSRLRYVRKAIKKLNKQTDHHDTQAQ